ncbi:hypothetical protein [Actinomyces lilanjuaniae]|uniref:hypothetical protein n=1 Tax=Actinomyces lilanjuaniae TaxID=2321394 RepID=UPI0013C52F66|nr:hypothetical protein [Actinomyces lilanjuaniae]
MPVVPVVLGRGGPGAGGCLVVVGRGGTAGAVPAAWGWWVVLVRRVVSWVAPRGRGLVRGRWRGTLSGSGACASWWPGPGWCACVRVVAGAWAGWL